MRKILVSVIFILILVIGAWAGLDVVKPAAIPEGGSEAFTQILNDVGTITVVPHPAGSEENRAVRDLIVNRAETLGLTAQVLPFEFDVLAVLQSDLQYFYEGNAAWRERRTKEAELAGFTDIEEYLRYLLNAQDSDILILDNVLIKVEGTAPQGAAMFVSHYDHVVNAPGAADDAISVASMLNLMQQLAQNPPQNDVYFLFTDGEERGLLGAADFVRTQPQYADEIDVILNFEARGNSGTLLMFETSGNDYELVKHYSQHTAQPVTFSLATAIYSMMPNGTDYTEFANAGYYGLNFAIIEGAENYHQPTDTLENLNKNSAWQYYQTMSALGNHFANTNLDAIQNNQSALYFPLPLVGIVVIPGWLGTVLGFVPLVLAALLIFFTMKNKDIKRGKKILRAVGLALLGIAPCAVTLFFFAGSYMFSIPAILFLLADFIMGTNAKRNIAGLVALEIAILISTLIFVPISFLIYVALGLWYATAIMLLLPLIPTVLYGVKLIRRV